jgi:hypothetical protein
MLTFFETLFAVGTLWFWLLFFIDFVVITALVENEQGFWATVTAIGSIIGLNYLWKLPILVTVKANPGHTALLILSYFLLGAGWSLVKWFFYLHKQRIKYEEYKAKFLEENKAKELTPELAAKLSDTIAGSPRRYAPYNDSEGVTATPPSARAHKGDLTRWATYWPFSIVGTLLNDVVRKAWTYIYELLQSTYQRMSNYVFRGALSDMALAQQFKEEQQVAKAAMAGDQSPRRTRPNN